MDGCANIERKESLVKDMLNKVSWLLHYSLSQPQIPQLENVVLCSFFHFEIKHFRH